MSDKIVVGDNTSEPAIKMVMMPRDTNHLGSIFGGHILSLIDQAAGYEARSYAPRNPKFVTKVMREVEFIAPVFVGDMVSFYTDTVKVGTSSITIEVSVIAQRNTGYKGGEQVTKAEVVMVAVDEKGSPVPILK